ncbi:hypothetical protein FRB91_008855 [Serendipita sp. 411]|nr:hypothetical protein FRB91_008855 [Serendipita sp. 411]
MIMQNKRASTIGRLESQVQPKLRRDVSKLIEDSRSFTSQSRSELQELGQLMDALDNSNKRLEVRVTPKKQQKSSEMAIEFSRTISA